MEVKTAVRVRSSVMTSVRDAEVSPSLHCENLYPLLAVATRVAACPWVYTPPPVTVPASAGDGRISLCTSRYCAAAGQSYVSFRIHVLDDHLSDVAQPHQLLQRERLLISGGSAVAVHGVGTVGQQPGVHLSHLLAEHLAVQCLSFGGLASGLVLVLGQVYLS